MRKISYFISLFALLFILAACAGKATQQDEKRALQIDSVSNNGVQHMQVSHSEQNVKLKGKDYHLFIRRMPADSLPHVKNDMGDIYADNTITLRITRNKGEKVFSKTFTKQDFSSVVSGNLLPQCILEGMVFDKTTPQGIVLAASISVPQTDLYVPVSITISPDGKMTMVKEEEMEDTYTNTGEE